MRIRKATEFSNRRRRYRANWPANNEPALLLFQPDVLLATEFFEGARRERRADPARKLMLAILEDAVNCLHCYGSNSSETARTLFRDARAWIMDRQNHWIFSFENVCESLQLNPEYIREGLRRWEERRGALHEQTTGL
jgi:hypothetical protein